MILPGGSRKDSSIRSLCLSSLVFAELDNDHLRVQLQDRRQVADDSATPGYRAQLMENRTWNFPANNLEEEIQNAMRVSEFQDDSPE